MIEVRVMIRVAVMITKPNILSLTRKLNKFVMLDLH